MLATLLRRQIGAKPKLIWQATASAATKTNWIVVFTQMLTKKNMRSSIIFNIHLMHDGRVFYLCQRPSPHEYANFV